MKNSIFNAATFAAVAIIGATALTAAKPASAQTAVNPILPVKGTREISLNGNFQFEPANNIDLNIGYGYFFNRNLEVSGLFGFADPDGGSSNFSLTGVVDYHFPSESALLPFVGLLAGFADPGGSSDTYFQYGVRGGVKYFLNPNVSANAVLQYAATDQDGDDEDFRLNFGLSIYLR